MSRHPSFQPWDPPCASSQRPLGDPLTRFLPDSPVLSRSRWVALRVFTLLKADALLLFFLMDSTRVLKNLEPEESHAILFPNSIPLSPCCRGQMFCPRTSHPPGPTLGIYIPHEAWPLRPARSPPLAVSEWYAHVRKNTAPRPNWPGLSTWSATPREHSSEPGRLLSSTSLVCEMRVLVRFLQSCFKEPEVALCSTPVTGPGRAGAQ